MITAPVVGDTGMLRVSSDTWGVVVISTGGTDDVHVELNSHGKGVSPDRAASAFTSWTVRAVVGPQSLES